MQGRFVTIVDLKSGPNSVTNFTFEGPDLPFEPAVDQEFSINDHRDGVENHHARVASVEISYTALGGPHDQTIVNRVVRAEKL